MNPEAVRRLLDALTERGRRMANHRLLGVRGLGIALVGVGVVLVAVAAVAVVGVLHAEHLDHRIQAATRTVATAQAEAASGQLNEAEATLSADESTIIGVNAALDRSPDFRLLSLLPVAHQNLDAVRSASRLGLSLLDDARIIVGSATDPSSPTGHLDLSLHGGQAPTAVIGRLRAQLGEIIPTLPTSPTPPSEPLLVGSVSRARTTLWAEAYQRRHELVTMDDALGVLNELTGGSGTRRYLIAVANTAEMRGAGGMILDYGVLNANHGKISVGAFGDIDQLLLHAPAARQFPADYNAAFADYHSNLLWRNATIMSDFTVDAPVLQSMYQAATGQHVDGVIQLDPVGLSAFLAGIGPIQDPTLGTLTAANVAPVVLNEAYLAFPDRSQRQSFTGNVARETFAALTSRPLVNIQPLIAGLNAVTADRHIVMWSSTPGIEPLVAGLGATGGLPGPGRAFTQLAIENMGGNKLDYYVGSILDVAGTAPTATTPGDATFTITVGNTSPPNPPRGYLFGPFDAASGDPPGVYHGLVTLYLPRGAKVLGTTTGGFASGLFVNFQDGLTAVSYSIDLYPGAQDSTTVQAELPPDPAAPGSFTVVPTPRVLPTVAHVDLRPPGARSTVRAQRHN